MGRNYIRSIIRGIRALFLCGVYPNWHARFTRKPKFERWVELSKVCTRWTKHSVPAGFYFWALSNSPVKFTRCPLYSGWARKKYVIPVITHSARMKIDPSEYSVREKKLVDGCLNEMSNSRKNISRIMNSYTGWSDRFADVIMELWALPISLGGGICLTKLSFSDTMCNSDLFCFSPTRSY